MPRKPPSREVAEAPDEPVKGASPSPPVVDRRITNGIAVVITFIWAAQFMADIFMSSFEPSPFVHLVFMGLAASVFGTSFLKGIGK